MGQNFTNNSPSKWCTSCTPDITSIDSRNNRNRTTTTSTDGTDSDSNQMTDSSTSNSIADDNKNSHNLSIAYDGWKKAIEGGNETLASYFMQTEYPNIDFFEYRWPNGDSALHIAVFNAKARLVFFLLTQGASANDQNPKTLNTPLHIAVHNDTTRPIDCKIIDLLLKWGADPYVSNTVKETPITIASTLKDQSIYELLCNNMDPKYKSHQNANTDPDLKRLRTNSDAFDSLRNSLSIWEWKQNSLDAKFVLENTVSEEPPVADKKKKKKSELALKANMIAVSNPFTGLGRRTTAQRENVVKENLELKPLPALKAWLEKRKPGVLSVYQRRWVIVKGAHLLWSSRQREIKNDANRRERTKFNGYIHFMTIDKIDIYPDSGTNKHRFMVTAKDAKHGNVVRDYIFRCNNDEDRDFWVRGLKAHKQQYHTVVKYLSH